VFTFLTLTRIYDSNWMCVYRSHVILLWKTGWNKREPHCLNAVELVQDSATAIRYQCSVKGYE